MLQFSYRQRIKVTEFGDLSEVKIVNHQFNYTKKQERHLKTKQFKKEYITLLEKFEIE